MSLGSVEGWVSPVIFGVGLPSYSTANMTDQTRTWIAATVPVTQIIFTFPVVYLADSFGRQPVLFSSFVPLTLSWLIIQASDDQATMIAGRVVAGIGAAMVHAIGPTYAVEVAGQHIRGRVASICYTMYHAGILFEFVAGIYLNYHSIAAASAIISIIFAATFIFMPETPHFLVISRRDDAEIALKRLRRINDPIKLKEELDSIEKSSVETLQMKWAWRDYFVSREARGSIFLSLCLVAFNELSFLSAMIKVLDRIWRMDGKKESNELFMSIIVASCLTVTSMFTSLMVEVTGRRALLVVSNLSAAVFLFGAGVCFLITSPPRWILLVMIGGFVSAVNMGGHVLVIPVVLETTPTKYRATAVGVTHLETIILMMIGVKVFLPLCDAIGRPTAFWFCSFICVMNAVFVIFFVPETAKKTFAEIQEDMNKRLSFLRLSRPEPNPS